MWDAVHGVRRGLVEFGVTAGDILPTGGIITWVTKVFLPLKAVTGSLIYGADVS